MDASTITPRSKRLLEPSCDSNQPLPARHQTKLINPFAGRLAKDLDRLQTTDPKVFIGFWLSVGTELTNSEIWRIDWKHVEQRDGLRIRGRLGARGEIVETQIHPTAASELQRIRQSTGPVLGHHAPKTWARDLGYFLQLSGWTLDELKLFLTPRPAKIVTERPARQETPKSKPAVKIELAPEPSSIITKEEPVSPPVFVAPSQPIEERQPKIEPPKISRRAPLNSGFEIGRHSQAQTIAKRLGMSTRWVKDRVKAGELVGYRFGTRIVVNEGSIVRFLEQRQIRGNF